MPLRNIQAILRRMAVGEIKTNNLIEQDSHDEIGEISHDFNIIIHNLEHIAEELNIDLQKEKKALQGSVDEYDRLGSEITRLTGKVDQLGEKRVHVTLQLKKTKAWLQIWPEWISLNTAQDKLKTLEPIESFPSQGLARLEGLYSRLEDLQKEQLKVEFIWSDSDSGTTGAVDEEDGVS